MAAEIIAPYWKVSKKTWVFRGRIQKGFALTPKGSCHIGDPHDWPTGSSKSPLGEILGIQYHHKTASIGRLIAYEPTGRALTSGPRRPRGIAFITQSSPRSCGRRHLDRPNPTAYHVTNARQFQDDPRRHGSKSRFARASRAPSLEASSGARVRDAAAAITREVGPSYETRQASGWSSLFTSPRHERG